MEGRLKDNCLLYHKKLTMGLCITLSLWERGGRGRMRYRKTFVRGEGGFPFDIIVIMYDPTKIFSVYL